jgi:hypothetical protein
MAEVQKDTIGSREDTLRFLDMVGLFSSQAMISLGKLANPMTGKAEKNLPAARLFIDTLEMLEHKTQGNLTPDEGKVLQATLTDLRLMYVEESKQPKKTEDPGQKTEDREPGDQAAKSEPPPSASSEKPQPDESKIRFRKTYE